MKNNYGISSILIIGLILIIVSIGGYFTYTYINSNFLTDQNLAKYEDYKKRYSFEYNKEYDVINLPNTNEKNVKVNNPSIPLELSRRVTLKNEKEVIYEIEISISVEKPKDPISKRFYYKQFDDYFLVFKADIRPSYFYQGDEKIARPIEDVASPEDIQEENWKEIEDDMARVVNSFKVTKPLFYSIDLSKAKKIDKLVDGYLVYSNSLPEYQEAEPVSYLLIVPSSGEPIKQEDISIIASYKFPSRNPYTIYKDNIYFIETIEGEQLIKKLNLESLQISNLVNIKNDSFYAGVRDLMFFDNKMYFIVNSELYEFDLNSGTNKLLVKLPLKTGVDLGSPNTAFGVNEIYEFKDSKFFMKYNTCPWSADHQGGCTPGGYYLSYNLKTNEIKEEGQENYNDMKNKSCELQKVTNGKLQLTKLNEEECNTFFQFNYLRMDLPIVIEE